MKNQIITKAILSEKAYKNMENGIYSFFVNEDSTKDQIKKEVERQFSTKVAGVRVISVSKKTKKITGTRKSILVGGGKKAMVTLVKGQTIAFLSPTTEKAKKAKKETTATKGTEKKGLLSKIKKEKGKQ